MPPLPEETLIAVDEEAAPVLLWRRLRALVVQFVAFASVSGVGWLLDLGLYTLLVAADWYPAVANACSAGCAVTVVFLVSVRRIFADADGFLWSKFLVYLLYQATIIAVFSAAIVFVVAVTPLDAWWAKIVVTPGNLLCNFFFMRLLTARPWRRLLAEQGTGR